MEEWLRLVIGILVIFLGVPIGNLLAKHTKDELIKGRKWFRRLIVVSFLGALASLFLQNDALLFTFLFIVIVTSRSVKKK